MTTENLTREGHLNEAVKLVDRIGAPAYSETHDIRDLLLKHVVSYLAEDKRCAAMTAHGLGCGGVLRCIDIADHEPPHKFVASECPIPQHPPMVAYPPDAACRKCHARFDAHTAVFGGAQCPGAFTLFEPSIVRVRDSGLSSGSTTAQPRTEPAIRWTSRQGIPCVFIVRAETESTPEWPGTWEDLQDMFKARVAEAARAHENSTVIVPDGTRFVRRGDFNVDIDAVKRGDEERWALAKELGCPPALVLDKVRAMKQELDSYGDVHSRLTELVDNNFGPRSTMPVDKLVGVLEQEVPMAARALGLITDTLAARGEPGSGDPERQLVMHLDKLDNHVIALEAEKDRLQQGLVRTISERDAARELNKVAAVDRDKAREERDGVKAELDARNTAADDAFDAIAKMLGWSGWEYPMQVVRGVRDKLDKHQKVETEREELRTAIRRCAASVGAHTNSSISHEFAMAIPDEVELMVKRTIGAKERAEAELAKARELLKDGIIAARVAVIEDAGDVLHVEGVAKRPSGPRPMEAFGTEEPITPDDSKPERHPWDKLGAALGLKGNWDLNDAAHAVRKLQADLDEANESHKLTIGERDRARAAVRIAYSNDVWFWQGEGDYPESLVCPVVMSADTLREFVSTLRRLLAAVDATHKLGGSQDADALQELDAAWKAGDALIR